MDQLKDMTQFIITSYALVNASYPKTGIQMLIRMKRKIMSEMMTTYFPSLLLMMITYATTFFKPFFFEAALSVNLTTMLVMTTIFISKMEGLPPTSATKMIDYWLILCQLVPFAQVVLLTAMEYLREGELDYKDSFDDATTQLKTENENEDDSVTKHACHMSRKKMSIMSVLIFTGKFYHSYDPTCPNFCSCPHQRRPLYHSLSSLPSSSMLGLLQASITNSFCLDGAQMYADCRTFRPKCCPFSQHKTYNQSICSTELWTPQCGVQLLSCIYPELTDKSHCSSSCFCFKELPGTICWVTWCKVALLGSFSVSPIKRS